VNRPFPIFEPESDADNIIAAGIRAWATSASFFFGDLTKNILGQVFLVLPLFDEYTTRYFISSSGREFRGFFHGLQAA
jgi:hypothetical protein